MFYMSLYILLMNIRLMDQDLYYSNITIKTDYNDVWFVVELHQHWSPGSVYITWTSTHHSTHVDVTETISRRMMVTNGSVNAGLLSPAVDMSTYKQVESEPGDWSQGGVLLIMTLGCFNPLQYPVHAIYDQVEPIVIRKRRTHRRNKRAPALR